MAMHLALMVFLAAIALPRTSRAGSPFLTDDPGFVPAGWEIKFASVYARERGQEVLTAPLLDLNYTIVPHVKLNLTLAEKTIFPEHRAPETGMADTDFKSKWRFLDESKEGWWPAISMAPNLTLPTADSQRGLGDGLWRFRLPLQIAKTLGRLYTYGELGYQRAFTEHTSAQLLYGYAWQYQLSDQWQIGAEINGSQPLGSHQMATTVVNLGAIYVLNAAWQLQATLGRTIRDNANRGPRFLSQVFLQWNFE